MVYGRPSLRECFSPALTQVRFVLTPKQWQNGTTAIQRAATVLHMRGEGVSSTLWNDAVKSAEQVDAERSIYALRLSQPSTVTANQLAGFFPAAARLPEPLCVPFVIHNQGRYLQSRSLLHLGAAMCRLWPQVDITHQLCTDALGDLAKELIGRTYVAIVAKGMHLNLKILMGPQWTNAASQAAMHRVRTKADDPMPDPWLCYAESRGLLGLDFADPADLLSAAGYEVLEREFDAMMAPLCVERGALQIFSDCRENRGGWNLQVGLKIGERLRSPRGLRSRLHLTPRGRLDLAACPIGNLNKFEVRDVVRV